MICETAVFKVMLITHHAWSATDRSHYPTIRRRSIFSTYMKAFHSVDQSFCHCQVCRPSPKKEVGESGRRSGGTPDTRLYEVNRNCHNV